MAVYQAVIGSAGGKTRRIKPLPGPQTLVDAALEDIRGEWAGDVLARYGF